jgi:hypothetical protein
MPVLALYLTSLTKGSTGRIESCIIVLFNLGLYQYAIGLKLMSSTLTGMFCPNAYRASIMVKNSSRLDADQS